MRQRRSIFKTFRRATDVLDNVIVVTVYVIVLALALRQLYRFVQEAFSR